MSLAAPAVAIANHVSSQPVGHAAPLLPTPPTGPLLATPPVVSLGAVAAAVAAALTPKGLVETNVGQHAASNLVRSQLGSTYFTLKYVYLLWEGEG